MQILALAKILELALKNSADYMYDYKYECLLD